MNHLPKRIYVLPAHPSGPILPRHVAPRQVSKRSIHPPPSEQVVAELLGEDMGPSGPRKRERLTHLTQEEKMDRRKMKNRVAAQNARDKKKERSSKIEDVVRDLVEENRRLIAENEMLRRENEELRYEREQERQQQQQQQPLEMVYIDTNAENFNNGNDENIYSNVAFEEEVVGEVQDRALESAEGTGPIYQPPPMYRIRQEDAQRGYVSDYRYDSMQPHGSCEQDDENLERILETLKSPPGEFDRFVAGYIAEGGDYEPSSSNGSFCSSSETRETLSPGSLALSPSTSHSSNDWDDESFHNYQHSATTSTDDSLTDPGNWNFETFDENSIDLNFFQNV